MRFTLKQLGYFVAAGEAGSILKAAENIHVSQPSISNAITQLEDTFGIQLFVRHHAQGMTLTTAGREFMHEANAVLKQANALHEFAGELSEKIIGTIELGCFLPLAPIITPELGHEFMSLHPQTKIKIHEAHQADLLQLLHQGTIDIALTYDLQLQKDIEFFPLATLPPYVLLSSDHPMSKRKFISLDDIADEPMVLLDLPLSSEYFMGLFNRKNLKPSIAARVRQTDVQRGLVASGHGYSLANVRPINKLALDGKKLKYKRLDGEHLPLTLGIATLKQSLQTQIQKVFISYCQDVINDRRIPGMVLDYD